MFSLQKQFDGCFVEDIESNSFNPILDGGGGGQICPPAGFFNIAQKPSGLGS